MAGCLMQILTGTERFPAMLRLAPAYVIVIGTVQLARYIKRFYVRTVSGTISLFCSKCFSPFPHGTGSYITIAAFLDGWLTCFATLWFATHHVFPLPEGFASLTGTSLAPVFPFPGQAFQPCPYSSEYMKYRNLHLLSIDYGFRPRLRSRLTQSRSALLWKP